VLGRELADDGSLTCRVPNMYEVVASQESVGAHSVRREGNRVTALGGVPSSPVSRRAQRLGQISITQCNQ